MLQIPEPRTTRNAAADYRPLQTLEYAMYILTINYCSRIYIELKPHLNYSYSDESPGHADRATAYETDSQTSEQHTEQTATQNFITNIHT